MASSFSGIENQSTTYNLYNLCSSVSSAALEATIVAATTYFYIARYTQEDPYIGAVFCASISIIENVMHFGASSAEERNELSYSIENAGDYLDYTRNNMMRNLAKTTAITTWSTFFAYRVMTAVGYEIPTATLTLLSMPSLTISCLMASVIICGLYVTQEGGMLRESALQVLQEVHTILQEGIQIRRG